MADQTIPHSRTIVTRAEAIAAGLKLYFTGIACRNGHISDRYVSGWSCVPCNRKNGSDWCCENRERRRHLERERYRADPEKFRAKNKSERAREYSKKWYRENRDTVLANTAARHRSNPEKKNAQSRARYRAFPVKAKEESRNGYARRKGADGKHTAQEIATLLKNQKFRCANPVCKASIRTSRHEDHIIPLVRGGSNWITNIQLLCAPCNLSKGKKDHLEWLRQNGMLL